jgi:hypothetical protein
MLGYCTNAKGYRVLLQMTMVPIMLIAQSRDVVLDEKIVGMQVLTMKRARDNETDADDVIPPAAPPVRGRTRVGRAVKAPERLGNYHVHYTLVERRFYASTQKMQTRLLNPLHQNKHWNPCRRTG